MPEFGKAYRAKPGYGKTDVPGGRVRTASVSHWCPEAPPDQIDEVNPGFQMEAHCKNNCGAGPFEFPIHYDAILVYENVLAVTEY